MFRAPLFHQPQYPILVWSSPHYNHLEHQSLRNKTGRKCNLQSTSTQYALNPLSSSTTLCSLPPTINFRPKTAFMWCSQRFDTRTRRKFHTACNPDLAHHTTRHTKPAPGPHQSTLLRMCHLYSARLPPQCLVELQFRDRLCIDTRIVQQPIMPGFRSQVCRLVKLKFRDCLKHRIQSSQPLRKLHLQNR